MGKRGRKAQNRIQIKWSSNFAYALGLLATDGCVYSDGRHFNLTSKDKEQVLNFKTAFRLENSIGRKGSGGEKKKIYYQIQAGDVSFLLFLKSIGIGPAKSKTLKEVLIPSRYFFDFLRGCFDGDGSFYSYWDPRWKSSFMFYLSFASASEKFITWIRSRIQNLLGPTGHVTHIKGVWQLRYAKQESELVIRRMYFSKDILYLSRKRLKINEVFAMMGKPKV